MVQASLRQFILLVPLFLVTLNAGLEEVDKDCPGNIECLHSAECETYQRAYQQMTKMENGSCERREAMGELRQRVCNKVEEGVCCVPCALGQICTPMDDCPSFIEEKKVLATLEKGSPEYRTALKRLTEGICDKKAKTVCCKKTFSIENCELESLSKDRPKRVDQGDSCDPASGSCLPGPARCGLTGHKDKCGDFCRVIGGTDASPGEFPFTALLGRKFRRGLTKEHGYVWTCGGSLINLRYVVTAAHCHHPDHERNQVTLVRLGEWEVTDHKKPDCTSDFCLEDIQEFEVNPEDVVVHPDFKEVSPGRVVNDIALIRLPRPAVENLGVRVACLPIDSIVAAKNLDVPDLGDGLSNRLAKIVGWGFTESDPTAKLEGGRERVGYAIQQKVGLPILSSSECGERYFDPRPDQICAGGEEGKGFCAGDSGGPLFMQRVPEESILPLAEDSHRPWYLLGIVSFGTCGASNPGMFTRTEKFVPWIRENIRD